jgi:hypothetical protein
VSASHSGLQHHFTTAGLMSISQQGRIWNVLLVHRTWIRSIMATFYTRAVHSWPHLLHWTTILPREVSFECTNSLSVAFAIQLSAGTPRKRTCQANVFLKVLAGSLRKAVHSRPKNPCNTSEAAKTTPEPLKSN